MIQNIDGSDPGICDDTVKLKELKVNFGQSVHLPCPSSKNLDIINTHAQQQPYAGGPSNNNNLLIPPSGGNNQGISSLTKPSVRWYYYKNDRSPGVQVLSTTYSNYISSSSNVNNNNNDRGSHSLWDASNNNFVYSKKIVQTIDGGLVILGMSERESGRYECRYYDTIPLIRYNLSMDPKTCSSSNESEFKKLYSDWCNEFEKYKIQMKNWQSKCNPKINTANDGTKLSGS